MSRDGLILSMRAESVLARLAGKADQLHAANVQSVTRLSIIVQTGVKEGKLTGQVLHVRTGQLRRSINRRVDVTDTAVTAAVGTNVKYGAIHEYGFDGTVTVQAHTRRSVVQLLAKRSQRDRKSDGTIQVRSFTRHVRMPERSFLRSEVRDRSDEIRRTIREDALRAVRQ